MKTTIIMPVSRVDYLDAIFARLEMLECDRKDTNLLCIVDGSPKLFVDVRNRVEMSKFADRLCVPFEPTERYGKMHFLSRRFRISEIHNELRKNIQSCDYVFGLEDDTIFSPDSLKKFLKHYSIYPYIGMVQGVQIGRWGIPAVGAWKVDDVYSPKVINSLVPPKLDKKNVLQEIDAGGLYCFMTTRDNYVSHDFKPFENNDMGPDFDFGIELRRRGMMNYIDWSITTTHRTQKGDITLLNTEPRHVRFEKKETRWRQTI